MKTTVLLDHEPVPDGGWMVHALLRIEGQAPAQRDRAPLNLSLVLDRSGSMAGDKLRAARNAAAMLVRRLSPADTVSVVAFDHDVRVVASPATGDDQAHLPELIEAIGPGGTTNLSGGWLRARDLVADNLRDGGVNRVILLTDGHANVGITEPERLVGLTRHASAKASVGTTTIGFGEGFDEDLLAAMADAGGGGTYYIEKSDQAAGIFEEELEGLLSIAAQNVRVGIRPGSGADFVKVLHEYPSHTDGDTLVLEVGDLYAREPRSLVMAFLVRPLADGATEAHVAHLTVTAHVLTADGSVELRELDIPVTLTPEEGGKAVPAVRKEILLVEAARVREDALRARERGDFAGAAASLRGLRERAGDYAEADPALAEELHDLESMAEAFDAEQVSAADVKYMKQRAYSAHRSRRESLDRFRRGGP